MIQKLQSIIYNDRNCDLEFLLWFYNECKNNHDEIIKIENRINYISGITKQLTNIKNTIDELSNDTNIDDYFKQYMLIKRDLRNAFTLLASFRVYDHWISPSNKGCIIERGAQENNYDEIKYLRTSDYKKLKDIEYCFIKEYFPECFTFGNDHNYFFTNTGMAAFEVAITVMLRLTNDDRNILIQNGIYHESRSYLETNQVKFKVMNIEDIFTTLETNCEIDCLILGGGITTFPTLFSLEILLNKLFVHRQKRLMFLIIDRTLTSFVDKYYVQLKKYRNNNIIYISHESLSKFYQFGLETTNMGLVSIISRLVRTEAVETIILRALNVSSSRPLPLQYYSMNYFNKELLKKRIDRISRNTKQLFDALSIKNERSSNNIRYQIISPCYKNSFYFDNEIEYIGLNILIYHHQLDNDNLINILNRIVEKYDQIKIGDGNSMGFDTTRIHSYLDIYSKRTPCIRISVGSVDIDIMMKQIDSIIKCLWE
jgi:hypothetical protein